MLPIILLEKNVTLADLEKKSGVAHATLFDIYSGKTDFKKCSIEVAIKLANALDMEVKDLYDKLTLNDLSDVIISRDFDLYRSNILHELKEKRYQEFVNKHKVDIEEFFKKEEFDKSLYTLTLIDDLVDKYDLDIDEDYSEIRNYKLDKILIPSSIYLRLKTKTINVASFIKDASKPFLKHNIFEEKLIYELL